MLVTYKEILENHPLETALEMCGEIANNIVRKSVNNIINLNDIMWTYKTTGVFMAKHYEHTFPVEDAEIGWDGDLWYLKNK